MNKRPKAPLSWRQKLACFIWMWAFHVNVEKALQRMLWHGMDITRKEMEHYQHDAEYRQWCTHGPNTGPIPFVESPATYTQKLRAYKKVHETAKLTGERPMDTYNHTLKARH